MSSYIHKITLDDSEMITINAALDFFTEKCEKELVNGAKAPYWAHLQNIKEIKKNLYKNSGQSSWNNF